MIGQQKKVIFEDMTLIDPLYPRVRVDLEWIGEGRAEYLDKETSDNEQLLRFTVYRRDNPNSNTWIQVEDASYCTNLPATAPRSILNQALRRIYDKVAREVILNQSVKKLCEKLSHISLEWFRDERPDMNEIMNQRVMESVADIAFNAGYMLAKGDIQVEDSRAFVDQMIIWSKEFNNLHQHDEWQDFSYIEAIDEFAKTKILDYCGVLMENRVAIEVVISDETNSEDNPGWDVDVYEKDGDRWEDLTRCGLPNLLFVNSYIDKLREKYNIILLNQTLVPMFFIKDCWAVKDKHFGYGDTFESFEDALKEHKKEDLLKGFCIKGKEDKLADVFTYWESRASAIREISENLKGIVG